MSLRIRRAVRVDQAIQAHLHRREVLVRARREAADRQAINRIAALQDRLIGVVPTRAVRILDEPEVDPIRRRQKVREAQAQRIHSKADEAKVTFHKVVVPKVDRPKVDRPRAVPLAVAFLTKDAATKAESTKAETIKVGRTRADKTVVAEIKAVRTRERDRDQNEPTQIDRRADDPATTYLADHEPTRTRLTSDHPATSVNPDK